MSENIIVGKHTLESLTSGMYADSFVVFREYIQNCVDSIDCAVEQGILKKGQDQITVRLAPVDKRIIIKDNGIGIPENETEKTLISIGNSRKSSNKSRGFRGIGRLSALSYCEQLTFITSAYGESIASKIIINAKKLAEILADDTDEDVTVVDVLQRVYRTQTFQEKESEHYFIVQMDGVKESSKLNSIEKVVDYLSQNVPAPYSPEFTWGKEIINRLKRENYSIEVYNISVIYGTTVIPIYKPYKDEFLVDRSKGIKDHITDIEIIKIEREGVEPSAVGWFAKTNYCGSICDKKIKGIRLRKGNILIGDKQTLNVAFKDARFNGWSIGEVFALDNQLIPNARRDNFEKNIAYYALFEQLSRIAAIITKDIRSASLKRNKELYKAIEQTDKVAQITTDALSNGITAPKKGAITQKIKAVQNAIENSSAQRGTEEYYKQIAFDELDMMIGKIKGATSYKALNTIDKLSNSEKRILERVFNIISNLEIDNSDIIIDSILEDFSN